MKRNRFSSKFLMLVLGGALLTGLSLTSCSKSDNDIFEDDPIVRIDKAKKELNAKLVDSENGWIMTFRPDGGKYLGEFNMWFDFKANGVALVKSDLKRNDLSEEVTEFNLVLLRTVALNFPLGSKMHEFTSMNDRFLRSDIEFNLSKYNEDGSITFEGYMSKQNVVLRKATAEEKKFNFAKKWAVYDNLKLIKKCTTLIGGKTANYDYGYLNGDQDWRSAEVYDSKDQSITESGVLTFAASEDGKKVNVFPKIELSDGSIITELDVVGTTFVGTASNGSKVTLTR